MKSGKTFKSKVLQIVAKISKGKFKTYKEVAILAGNPKAYRAVGNLMAKNHDPKIPCHRVIKSDLTVGGYRGSINNSQEKLAKLLEEGVTTLNKNAKIKEE